MITTQQFPRAYVTLAGSHAASTGFAAKVLHKLATGCREKPGHLVAGVITCLFNLSGIKVGCYVLEQNG